MIGWRKLLIITLLFSCIDGFISYLLYPATLPFLYKDILFSIIYLNFFLTREPGRPTVAEFRKRFNPGAWHLAVLLIIWGGLQMFNPGVPSLTVGLFGFKTMFFYWPLAIVGYAYVDSVSSLQRLMRTIVYFSIPICIFGLYQFWQGPDFMPQTFGSGFKKTIVLAGGVGHGAEPYFRVLGTFASSGQFTAFLVVNIVFIFGLLFTTKSKAEKLLMIGCLVLNYFTILTTGSRGGFLLLFPTALLFAVLCRWLWRAFFIIFILGVSLSFGFNYLGKNVVARFKTVDQQLIRSRTVEATGGMFLQFLEQRPFGRGLGTGTVAARRILKESPTEIDLIENYCAKLQSEVGLPGLVLFYLLLINLTVHWARRWFKPLKGKAYILMAAVTSYCWTMFAYSLVGVIDAAPLPIFLWLQVGAAARLATLKPDEDNQYPIST